MKNTELDRRGFIKVATMGAALAITHPVWAQPAKYDVIVIGAGLSGLHTVHLLEQRGMNVLLLESRQRVGGRVHTLDHLAGHPEAGAMQVGNNYTQLHNIIERLNVPLEFNSGVGGGGPASPALAIGGQMLKSQDWADHAVNKLSTSERSLPPGFLLWNYLTKDMQALATPEDWLSEKYRHLDIPLDVYLKQQGASEEALRLMNNNFQSNNLNEVSALHTIRKFSVIAQSGGAKFIKDRTARLPEAMAANLKNRPLLDKAVTSIKQHNNGVRVTCADKSHYSASRCVIATPFSTLRKIDLRIKISEAKKQAIDNLAYSHITQVYLRPTREFWLEDNLTPDIWTDSQIGMIATILDADQKVSLLQAWLVGENARMVNGLSKAEIGQLVVKQLATLRPASKDNLVVEEVIKWGTNPNSLGAYAHFRPGDASRFAAKIAVPEGPLHFVGEHTDFRKSGMEAAVLSAERGANQLIASM